LQFEKEIKNLSRAFHPTSPFIFILGGAKFDTKMPLLDKFMKSADIVFVGGALANDLLKAKGIEVGQSLVSTGDLSDIRDVAKSSKLMLPIDAIDQDHSVRALKSLGVDDKIMDIGPVTLTMLREKIMSAKFVLWNGPMGMYEGGFQGATLEVARMISEATVHGGVESVVGGGDTLSAIESLDIGDKFSFVSTGGGAMLQYLADETLPGIEALK
jgi:phosphoglycerate kinase